MKVSYELKQGYIDIWNEESEKWDRYIKVNTKSVVEEPKGIPKKLEILPDSEHYSNKVLYGKINEIIDTLEMLNDKIK